MIYVDLKILLRTYLLAQSTLVSAVDVYAPTGQPQIFVPGLPRQWGLSRAVTVRSSGGAGDIHLPRERFSVQARCYALTIEDANILYGVFESVMHRRKDRAIIVDGQKYVIQYIQRVSGPTDEQEFALTWPYVQAQYQVQFLNQPI